MIIWYLHILHDVLCVFCHRLEAAWSFGLAGYHRRSQQQYDMYPSFFAVEKKIQSIEMSWKCSVDHDTGITMCFSFL